MQVNISRQFGEWGISLKSSKLSRIFNVDKNNVNNGIRHQFALVAIVLILGTIALVWVLNTCFIGVLYRNERTSTMQKVFDSIDNYVKKGGSYDESKTEEIERIAIKNNIDIVVATPDGRVLSSNARQNNLSNEIRDVRLNVNEGKILISKQNYTIQLMDKSEGKIIVLTGMLSDGNYIMMRYSMENLNAFLYLSDRFLLVVAIISAFIAFIIAEWFTERLTRPLVKLTNISQKMTNLDFSEKFVPNKRRRNEVDVLGEHMNIVSETLEETLDELQEANEELKKDIEIMDKNEKMRKEFLSNASHELKTPIALIQGYAEGLAEGMGDDPESREYYCEVIVDEAKKMNKLVQQLMSLDEIEYGIKNIDKKPFELTEMLNSLVNASQILMEQNDITLKNDISENVNAFGDEFVVEQVFLNYLSNAIHYCKNDKIITISQEVREDKVRVTVYNTGDNIPDEDIEHLWDKFYKVDKARTREYGGSGVGLSIVKAAMESMKNEYGVYNTNEGVAFWFELDK